MSLLAGAKVETRSTVRAFRDDINGLRALAVLGVVLFHFGAPVFNGGYVGVDVFFVISGFLMSQIIVSRLCAGRFGILDFYRARARRIVPALVGLTFALLVFGACAVDPELYATIGRGAVSSLLFVSNIQYYLEAGYFDIGSTSKWLLHTWSLSVEWQFYLVYPLVLAAVWRVRPSRLALAAVVGLIGAVSLVLCIVAMRYRPSAAFFLLPMRAWEMAAGGLIAIRPPGPLPDRTARALQLIGLLAILCSMLIFDSLTPWPSYRALLPVLGTCLVILADRRASRLTGNPPLRLIGLWSYSIYIWHWPLAVGSRYFVGNLSFPIKLGLLAIVMVCGGAAFTALSRLPAPWVGRMRAMSAAAFALTLVAGIVVVRTGGLEQRRPALEATLVQLRAAKGDWAFSRRCGSADGHGGFSPCSIPGTRPGQVLFIGDSEAEAIYGRWGPQGAGPNNDHPTLSFLTYGGCPVLPGVNRREAGFTCASYLEQVLAFAERGSFQRVVFTSLWAGYFSLGTDSVCFPMPGACPAAEGESLRTAMADAVSRLKPHILKLKEKGTEVVILLTIPYSSYDTPRELAKRLYLGWPTADVVAIDRAAFLKADELARAPLRELAAQTAASIVDPASYLCGSTSCPTGDDATSSYYRDSVHIRTSVMRSDRFKFLDALTLFPGQVHGGDASAFQSTAASPK